MDVTTDAEASNTKLGMVVKVTSADTSTLKQLLTDSRNLAAGYTSLYQGNSATGANIGGNPRIGGVYNGYLPGVEGASLSPGPSYISGTKKVGPQFPTPPPGPGRRPRSSTSPPGSSARSSSRASSAGQLPGPPRPGQFDPGRRGPADQHRLDRTHGPPRDDQFAAGRHPDHRPEVPCRHRRGHPGRPERQGHDRRRRLHRRRRGRSTAPRSVPARPSARVPTCSTSTFPANTVIPPGAIYINNKFQGYVQSPS